jgi:uroporphyrinogen-III synthase
MRVLVTRPRDKAARLLRRLESRGHEALTEPLLAVHEIDPGPIDVAGVQAVIVTSASAAFALARVGAPRPVLAVGAATALAAREAGAAVAIEGRGDGRMLALRIAAACRPEAGALLHLAGREVRPGLAEALAERGFGYRRLTVYEARPAEALSPAAALALRAGTVDAVLLLSPRTATTFARLVEAAGLGARLVACEAICLSAAIAEGVQSLPWRAVRVAERPEEEALARLLEGPRGR